MLNIILEEKYLLDSKYLRNTTSITYDGKNFYLCDNRKAIIYKLCNCAKLIGFFSVDKCYRAISYDYKEECYWAIENEQGSIIYKLNRDFDEIGRINLFKIGCMNFISIYYDNCNKCIYLYTIETIYTLSKNGEVIRVHKNPCGLSSCYGCTVDKKKLVNYNYSNYRFSLINILDEYYCLINKQALPEGFYSNGICSVYDCDNNPYLFIMAYYESNQPYILKYKCIKKD